jgi:hypothetical protein
VRVGVRWGEQVFWLSDVCVGRCQSKLANIFEEWIDEITEKCLNEHLNH